MWFSCKLWQSFAGSVPLNESSVRARRGGSPGRINFSGSDKSNWRKICGPRSLITVIVSLGYHRTINYPLKMAADLQSRISSGGRPLPIRQLFIQRCRMRMIVLLCADRVRELVAGHNGAVSLEHRQRALLAVARVHSVEHQMRSHSSSTNSHLVASVQLSAHSRSFPYILDLHWQERISLQYLISAYIDY